MKYIDADKLKAEIGRLKEKYLLERWDSNYDTIAAQYKVDAYNELLPLIESMEKEPQEIRDLAASYCAKLISRLESRRVLPTFTGKLLHDFKNEVYTVKQLFLGPWSDIENAIFDKIALTFAAWGGYHFHPNEQDSEDALQQEQPTCETLGQEIEKAWKPYDQLGFDLTKSQFADIARHFAMWGIHTAESCKVEEFKQEQSEAQDGKFVFPKYLYARTKDNKTIDMSYAPQDMTAVEYIRNDFVEQKQPENEEKIINFFDAVGDCGFSQHDILLLKNIWKETGCPPPKSQVADASKMEQPEVDLEKEIDKEWEDCGPIDEGMGYESALLISEQFHQIARHFYELGLNARKE